jgi:hypothetical protein
LWEEDMALEQKEDGKIAEITKSINEEAWRMKEMVEGREAIYREKPQVNQHSI